MQSRGEGQENADAAAESTTEEIKTVALADADVGDMVQFGRYEQDGSASTKGEPIFWEVLEKKDDCILVISHLVLARGQFSDDEKNVVWEDSQIRQWLNGTFYNQAFDEAEKSRIVDSVISNPGAALFWESVDKGDKRGILGDMPDTEDRVFLLSWEEILACFKPEIQINIRSGVKYYGTDNLIAKPSFVVMLEDYKYCEEIRQMHYGWPHARYKFNGVYWLLRSQGTGSEFVMVVNLDGHIVSTTPKSISGIRPAMWIRVQ